MEKQDKTEIDIIGWTDGNFIEEFEMKKDEIPLMVREKGLTSLMLNFQNLDYFFSPETIGHVVENWLPKLAESQLKKLGILVPTKVIGQVSIKNTFGEGSFGDLQISFFDDLKSLQKFLAD